jgi:hypothetical protein
MDTGELKTAKDWNKYLKLKYWAMKHAGVTQ